MDLFIEIVSAGEVRGGLEENGVVKVIGLGIVVKSQSGARRDVWKLRLCCARDRSEATEEMAVGNCAPRLCLSGWLAISGGSGISRSAVPCQQNSGTERDSANAASGMRSLELDAEPGLTNWSGGWGRSLLDSRKLRHGWKLSFLRM